MSSDVKGNYHLWAECFQEQGQEEVARPVVMARQVLSRFTRNPASPQEDAPSTRLTDSDRRLIGLAGLICWCFANGDIDVRDEAAVEGFWATLPSFSPAEFSEITGGFATTASLQDFLMAAGAVRVLLPAISARADKQYQMLRASARNGR